MSLMRYPSWDPWVVAPRVIFNQDIGSDFADFDRQMRSVFENSGQSELQVDKNKFQVKLDCHHFKPEEMTVKIKDNLVTIHAKHEEKQDDHGYVSREFTRSYMLPPGCDVNNIKSQLSNQGLLSITCPRQVKEEEKGFKTIPIERTQSKAIQH